ncbi:MAG: sulfite oxidase-like oxidoreductase [Zestosphaera tikiterensis]|uniref:Sulfite oxidase-like oxidoreductase n=1 Tax=Zestosphaera tikiterensis TaxID=1973259 RepID=A0A2R7Y5P6_9CREN|nr:MAG: sulfite oxidase-like oxidoreductase [Zestosphaera tikiterensis]
MDGSRHVPPGQKIIPNFIIYRILGQPNIDVQSWTLKVKGEVEREMTYTYEDLLKLADVSYVEDFHCVTGWSVENVRWEGVSLRKLIEASKPRDTVKWVYVLSVDNYTTIIPIEDALHEKAILALKINGKPLTLEQGFPARIFIPHLYGWKSAKWVSEITLLSYYKDGYWEALGYHERGNVWNEERFKW